MKRVAFDLRNRAGSSIYHYQCVAINKHIVSMKQELHTHCQNSLFRRWDLRQRGIMLQRQLVIKELIQGIHQGQIFLGSIDWVPVALEVPYKAIILAVTLVLSSVSMEWWMVGNALHIQGVQWFFSFALGSFCLDIYSGTPGTIFRVQPDSNWRSSTL